MQAFKAAHPELWDEDIGEDIGDDIGDDIGE